MASRVERLFQKELQKREIKFEVDPDTGLHTLYAGETTLSVSLDNLEKEYERKKDGTCVAQFLDTLLTIQPGNYPSWEDSKKFILFALEPNDYRLSHTIRTPVSKRVDRIPVLLECDEEWFKTTWIGEAQLAHWGVTLAEVEALAFENLDAAIAESIVEYEEFGEVRLGMITAPLPFKAPILLAPSLKSLVEKKIGWPVLAVAPDFDFLYIWAAKHEGFAPRVGASVVKEYTNAPHPLTKEVFRIDDDGIKAIGTF